jgi:outer membrane protein TolC
MKNSMPRLNVFFVLILLIKWSFAQYSLDYFLNKAGDQSPALKEYRNLQAGNQVQSKLNHAQNSAFQVSVTGNYLFTPYFNNNGDLVSSDPAPKAVGYDIALFDGGLYSAQVNVERNLFNGSLIHALDRQLHIQGENYQYGFNLERHSLDKSVTEQYLNTLQSLLLRTLSREVVDNIGQQLELTGEMMKKGYAQTQDYLLLQIEVKNQTVALCEARQQYKSNVLQLYALCGIQDTAVVEISPVELDLSRPILKSNFTQKYILDSLAVVAEQALFETKYQPQLQAFVNTGLNAVQLQHIQRKFGMSAGLNLSVPLFDGHQKSLTRQQNHIIQQTIRDYRRFSEREIMLQRANLQSQIESLKKNIESMSGQIRDYNSLLELSAKQLQQGNISMIDYMTLLRNFVDLRKNKIGTEMDYQRALNDYNYWNW